MVHGVKIFSLGLRKLSFVKKCVDKGAVVTLIDEIIVVLSKRM